ncbi:MAG: hypothetical protein ACLTYW_11190 [Collinsella sp.]
MGAFGPTAVNPASPQYGKILETPKTAWRYFDLLGTIQNELNSPAATIPTSTSPALGEVTFGCARPHRRGLPDHRHRRGCRRALGRSARAWHDASRGRPHPGHARPARHHWRA